MKTITNTTYGKHPDEDFVKMFSEKPYQGQHPAKASLIILGYDANYSEQVRNHRLFFPLVREYHNDGVLFWQKYGVHHPFLHSSYPFHKGKDGVPYHSRFSKLEIGTENADKVSFVELLNVPTVGNRSQNKHLFRQMLQKEHLLWLEEAIFSGNKKLILLSPEFLSEYLPYIQTNFSVFRAISKEIPKLSLFKVDNASFYNGYHFSSSHIFTIIPELKEIIKPYLT